MTYEKYFILNNRYEITIPPFYIPNYFQVTKGKEIYFYDTEEKDEEFDFLGEVEGMDFDLFEYNAGVKNIYLDDIPISCYSISTKFRCTMSSLAFPQNEKYQTYNVYIKDSLGNKKRNYFVLPIRITLDYL